MVEVQESALANTVQATQPQTQTKEIAFIDANVADLDGLIDSLGDSWQAGRDIEVVFITEDSDPFRQISSTLATKSDIGAIHIFTRAEHSTIVLGASALDAQSLATNATAIRGWQRALGDQPEILLYGEQPLTASETSGLTQALMRLTGARVDVQQDESSEVAPTPALTASPATPRDVVLIDRHLDDSAALIAAADPSAVTYVYDSASQSANGVLQWVTQWAIEQNAQIASLSILSHGAAGGFELGNQWITTASLDDPLRSGKHSRPGSPAMPSSTFSAAMSPRSQGMGARY